MSATHMRIQNVILFKRYIKNLNFNNSQLTVVYTGGGYQTFLLQSPVTPEEVSTYLSELEDR